MSTYTESNIIYKLVKGTENTAIVKGIESKVDNADVVIPDIVTTGSIVYNVVSIENDAFRSIDTIKKITISKNITNIGDYAFFSCVALSEVTILESVATIGDYAFLYCPALKKFTVTGNPNFYNDANGVLIKGKASDSKTTLIQYPLGKTETTYTIPDNVTVIKSGAFVGNIYLEEFKVGTNTTFNTDTSGALFSGTTLIQYPLGNKARSYTLPDNIKTIENFAFTGCYNISKFTVSNNPNFYADDRALFSGTSNGPAILIQYAIANTNPSYTVPSNVISIAEYSFTFCTSLTSLKLQDGLTSIGVGAFYGCTKITSVTIPNSVTNIKNSAFAGCTSLESINIPNGVTIIENNTFINCTSLKSVIIPGSIISIKNNTFAKCTSLESVIIPESMISMESSAFYNCSKLAKYKFIGKQPTLNGDFEGSPSNAVVNYYVSYKSDWNSIYGSLTTVAVDTAKPDPPTVVRVMAVSGLPQAIVSWIPPVDNGGIPITSYTVTSSPESTTTTQTAKTSPLNFTGLKNGTSYIFTVFCTNSNGNSNPSLPSDTIIITVPPVTVTVPNPPTSVNVKRGNGLVNVSWTPPTNDGGAAIIKYTVYATSGSTKINQEIASTSGPNLAFKGLKNGSKYTFTVAATNSVGQSSSSAPSPEVIPATVPNAPTNVKLKRKKGMVDVSWKPPKNNGGDKIIKYTVYATGGGKTIKREIKSKGKRIPATKLTVKGLKNGIKYKITVAAANSVGQSKKSRVQTVK